MLLEICANSYASAKNAEDGGAQRIELCSELSLGGLTPNYGLLKKVKTDLSIDVFVLIRPRSGNFCYSNAEFEIMKHNVALCKELGCEGIVSGVLNEDQTIDVARTQELIDLAGNMEFTFHRAFDWTPDPFVAMEQLIGIGANRILTSGQETSAENGLEVLIKLKELAADKIKILPGGGMDLSNVGLFKEAGFHEIHASLTTLIPQIHHTRIPMNSSKHFSESFLAFSDPDKIKALVKFIQNG